MYSVSYGKHRPARRFDILGRPLAGILTPPQGANPTIGGSLAAARIAWTDRPCARRTWCATRNT